jgi:hypothetical protein
MTAAFGELAGIELNEANHLSIIIFNDKYLLYIHGAAGEKIGDFISMIIRTLGPKLGPESNPDLAVADSDFSNGHLG